MKYHNLMFAIAALLCLASVVQAADQPPPPWMECPLEDRVVELEKQVVEIQKRLGSAAEECPCPNGKCTCPSAAECDCSHCPVHSQAVVWAGTPNELGRSVEIDSAPDCLNCAKLKEGLKPFAQNIKVVQYPSVARNPHDALPYARLLIHGEVVERLHASACSAARIRDFLEGKSQSPSTNRSRGQVRPAQRAIVRRSGPTWTWPGDLATHLARAHGVNPAGMSFEQMRALHDNLHNSQSRASPRPYYVPRQYFAPASGYCPSCVR